MYLRLNSDFNPQISKIDAEAVGQVLLIVIFIVIDLVVNCNNL